ncbi:MAG TPA: condensation domain-containing protein, partial [Jatrophihabitans sp.]
MTVPLSLPQQRLWFLSRATHSATYNICLGLELSGPADLEALARAVQDVVDRHEPLRTIYPEGPDGPYQSVQTAARASVPVPVVHLPAEEIPAAMRGAAAHVFDLTTELPIRALLMEISPELCVLFLAIHHISCDGGSMRSLLADLDVAYGARISGQAPRFAELPVSYRDYTLWQREVLGSEDDPGSLAREQLNFWSKALAHLPRRPVLPHDRARDSEPPPSEVVEFSVPAALHRRLYEIGNRTRSSMFMVVQAAIVAVLTRLGAGTDIILGTVVSGRTDEALDDLVGFFVNTLVLRTDTSGNPT